jgi:hypothetical protein
MEISEEWVGVVEEQRGLFGRQDLSLSQLLQVVEVVVTMRQRI